MTRSEWSKHTVGRRTHEMTARPDVAGKSLLAGPVLQPIRGKDYLSSTTFLSMVCASTSKRP